MTTIEKMVQLQKAFKKMYPKDLIGISEKDVHVTLDFILDCFDKEDMEVTYFDEDFPYEFTAYHDGVRFFTLARKYDLEDYRPEVTSNVLRTR